jgi:CheY-like chemotaxis protein
MSCCPRLSLTASIEAMLRNPSRAYETKVQYRYRLPSLSLAAEGARASHVLPATGLFIMETVKPFVIIVDDDDSVSRAIRRLLGSIGIRADTFSSGNDFLEALSSIPSYYPGCVILDVLMPGLSGLEVQRRLAGSGIPVVFITAHDDIGVREQALANGAAGYLRKPFDDKLFVRAVRSALERSPQQ